MNNYCKGFLFSFFLHLGLVSAIFALGLAVAQEPTGLTVDISLIGFSRGNGGGGSASEAASSHQQLSKATNPQDAIQTKPGVLAPRESAEKVVKTISEPAAQEKRPSGPQPEAAVVQKQAKPQPPDPLSERQKPLPQPLSKTAMPKKTQTQVAGTAPKSSSQSDSIQATAGDSSNSGFNGSQSDSKDGRVPGAGKGATEGYLKANYAYIRKHIRKHLRYPPQAKRMNMQGRAYYSFTIEHDGRITGILLDQSCGFDLLDEAGMRAIRDASPLPPPPGKARIGMPVDFTLR